MNKKLDVLVTGSYAVGLVMETSRLPGPGETVIGRNFRATHGGKGSNQAVQAARLGAKTAFIGMTGRDSYSADCEKLHRSEGVVTEGLLRHESLPTGVGFIVVDEAGRNLITLDMGANDALTPEMLAEHRGIFADAKVVLAQLEIRLETALAAMRLGRETGAVTILNPAPALELTACDLACVDYLVPNETEARVCAGLPLDAPLEEAVELLLERGCGAVIVTLGEKGCRLSRKGAAPLEVAAFPLTAVDTVGAGDSFCGALSTALAEGKPVADALRFANAAAALSVTKPDTVPSYHTRAEVERLLAGAG